MVRPLLLIVIDGFGLAPPGDGNAISLARTPVLDRLHAEFPWAPVQASGLDVGLPAGIMGNSEVGHMNIGAGRVVPQDIVRIDEAISSGSLPDNETLRDAANAALRRGGRLHLMGLYSPGKVHASDAHVRALIDAAAAHLPPDRVFVHLFADGRDTPPRSAEAYFEGLIGHAQGKAILATVSGRYFAMDRDTRWERTELAYRAVVAGDGAAAGDALDAVRRGYDRGETDEFLTPTVLASAREVVGDGTPLMGVGDATFFWNFRADRARQMCAALVDPAFDGFARGAPVRDLHLASMTVYDEQQTWPAAFPPVTYDGLLSEEWSAAGLRQLRIAETEKYAHVTYFFNGGKEAVLPGEDRILIPSPRVATYDEKPEMSAPGITAALLAAHAGFDRIVLNFANPDMVGHTGDVAATVRAVEVVDDCIGRLAEALFSRGGVVAVTADHGNAEMMFDPATGQPHTAHTIHPVPFLVAGAGNGFTLALGGRLADIAPTLLELDQLEPPPEMTGRSLVTRP